MTKQEYDSIMKGRPKGFKIMFHRYVQPRQTEGPEFYPEDGVLMKGQKPMTEAQAWAEAEKLAGKTKSYLVNLTVVDENFTLVRDWKEKQIHNDFSKSH